MPVQLPKIIKPIWEELRQIAPLAFCFLVVVLPILSVVADPIPHMRKIWFPDLPTAVATSRAVEFVVSHWTNLCILPLFAIATHHTLYSPVFAMAFLAFLFGLFKYLGKAFLLTLAQPAIAIYMILTLLAFVFRNRLFGHWSAVAACICLILNGLVELVPGAYANNTRDPVDFVFGAVGLLCAYLYVEGLERAFPRGHVTYRI